MAELFNSTEALSVRATPFPRSPALRADAAENRGARGRSKRRRALLARQPHENLRGALARSPPNVTDILECAGRAQRRRRFDSESGVDEKRRHSRRTPKRSSGVYGFSAGVLLEPAETAKKEQFDASLRVESPRPEGCTPGGKFDVTGNRDGCATLTAP